MVAPANYGSVRNYLARLVEPSSHIRPRGRQSSRCSAADSSCLPRLTRTPRQQDQRTGGDQPKADHREVGRDWRTRPGDGDRIRRDDRMGRDDREVGRDWHPDRGSDMDHDGYREQGDRGWDRADRDMDNRGYFDEDRPRRRVKI